MAHKRQDEFRRAYFITHFKDELSFLQSIEASIENAEVNATEIKLFKDKLLPDLYRKSKDELMEALELQQITNKWFENNFIETVPRLKESGSLVREIAMITTDESEAEYFDTAHEVKEWLLDEINSKLPEYIDTQAIENIQGVS